MFSMKSKLVWLYLSKSNDSIIGSLISSDKTDLNS
jgi:hypothetical protein